MNQNFAESALALCREQLAVMASGFDGALTASALINEAGRIMGEQFRKAAKGGKEQFNALYESVRNDAQLQDENLAKLHGEDAVYKVHGTGENARRRGIMLNRVSALASKVRKECFPAAKKGAQQSEPDSEPASDVKESAPDAFEPAFLLVMAEAEAALPPTKHAAFLKLAAEVAKYHKQKVGK